MSTQKNGNKWSFRIDIGKDPQTGKRRQKYKGGFKTKKEAEFAKAELLSKINREGYFQPKKELMESFLPKWLHNVDKHEVKLSTYEKVESIVRVHLLPKFAKYEVGLIKPYIIQEFFSQKLDGGLSPSMVKNIKNVLSKSFQTAIDWEIIKENPVAKVKGPSIEKKEKETWSETEAKRFLDSCEKLRWKVAFLVGLHTGMRRGEILALKWENLDFGKSVYSVKETVVYTKSEGLSITTPKTPNSIRDVLLPKSLLDALAELKKEQDIMRKRMGTAYHSNDLVICTMDGKPIDPHNLSHTFDKHVEKAGVKRLSLHGLRHTNATILMREGINPKIVSERLGHANVAITLDLYSHTDLDMQRATTSLLDGMFN